MNDFQRSRLKEFCEFYNWPEHQTNVLFEFSKEFFECVWRGMDPKTREEEMNYYNGPWLTLRQMSYNESESFPDEAKKLIDELPKGSKVLDFGCGVGDGLIYAVQKGMRSFGVEVDKKIAFIIYRMNSRKLIWTLADQIEEYKDHKFDLSLLISSLDHVPDPVALAKRVCEMTKGKIYADPCIDETYDRPTHNKEILKQVPEAFRIIDEHNKRTS